MNYCEICYIWIDEDWKCDRCECLYCEKCSSRFTIHNQIDYPCCIICADQMEYFPRKSYIRTNRINILMNITD